MSDLQACYAHRQLCVCDRCEEEVQLINMAQWEFAEWESGISWCRRCFQMCGQFKTERNTGPRVPDKKKQAQVNTSVQKICTQHPVSWSECMTCIDAEFPDPTETCKFLQSDAKRVPKTSVGKHCELVRSVRRVCRLSTYVNAVVGTPACYPPQVCGSVCCCTPCACAT